MIKDNLIPALKRLQIIEIFDELHFKGCCYGQPDGPDDYVKECDCWYDDEDAELIRNINEIWKYLVDKEYAKLKKYIGNKKKPIV